MKQKFIDIFEFILDNPLIISFVVLLFVFVLVVHGESQTPKHLVPYCQSYEGQGDNRCNGYYTTNPSVDAGFVIENVK